MKNPKDVLEKDGVKGCFTLIYDTLGKNKYAISIGATTIVIFMVGQIKKNIFSCFDD